MGKGRLVRRHIVGEPTQANILVRTEHLRERGTVMRIEPDDRSILARALTRDRQQDSDGGFSIPVEKR